MKKIIVLLSCICCLQIAKAQNRNCRIDSDSDGVVDCRDKCPNTPKNVLVDSHGCPRDTDVDGVPDYLDKELITKSDCYPVDADGVGTCNRSKNISVVNDKKNEVVYDSTICIIKYAKENYAGYSIQKIKKLKKIVLTTKQKTQLDNIVNILINDNKNFIEIKSNGTSINGQIRSWQKAYAIYKYLLSKGIDENRFIISYGNNDVEENVSIKFVSADTPNQHIPPPPFSDMKY